MILKLAKRYGLCGFIRLVRDVLLTRVFYRNCRIIRFPCYIRNDGSINLVKISQVESVSGWMHLDVA